MLPIYIYICVCVCVCVFDDVIHGYMDDIAVIVLCEWGRGKGRGSGGRGEVRGCVGDDHL